MRAAGRRVTSVPFMYFAVRVNRSIATVSAPRRARSVVAETGSGTAIDVDPDEQATSGSAASATTAARRGDAANMEISGGVRRADVAYGSAVRIAAHGPAGPAIARCMACGPATNRSIA